MSSSNKLHSLVAGLVSAVLASCGSGESQSNISASPDAALQQPIPTVDAAVELPLVCPNRTSPRGLPSVPLTAAEIVSGDVTIRSSLDVTVLQGKKAITGSLTIEGFSGSVALPDLLAIGGRLIIGGQGQVGLAKIEFPTLETTGKKIEVQGVETFSAPLLEQVGEWLAIRVATDINIPCLRDIEDEGPGERLGVLLTGHMGSTLSLGKLKRGPVRIDAMPNLTILRLPSYERDYVSVGNVFASYQGPTMTSLTSIELPAATQIDSLDIANSPALRTIALSGTVPIGFLALNGTSIDNFAWLSQRAVKEISLRAMPLLTSLQGIQGDQVTYLHLLEMPVLTDLGNLGTKPDMDDIFIGDNPALTSINFVGVTSLIRSFDVINNTALLSLKMPALRVIKDEVYTDTDVVDNPMLPDCYPTNIKNVTSYYRFTIKRNNPAGVCN
jgi:hypothetical protein